MSFENERGAILLADQIHQELRKARERIKELEAQCYRWEEKCGDLSGERRKAEESETALQAMLRTLEFSAPGDRCPVCAGWNMSENGETSKVHTKTCALSKLLEAV